VIVFIEDPLVRLIGNEWDAMTERRRREHRGVLWYLELEVEENQISLNSHDAICIITDNRRFALNTTTYDVL
jgi:hypothetical protein